MIRLIHKIITLVLVLCSGNIAVLEAKKYTVTRFEDDDAKGSLRWAIRQANKYFNKIQRVGEHTAGIGENIGDRVVIDFSFDQKPISIVLEKELPAIKHKIIIDGLANQMGIANTATCGNNAQLGVVLQSNGIVKNGIVIRGKTAEGAGVKGLVFNGFSQGIVVEQGAVRANIENNFIGVDYLGKKKAPNFIGVLLKDCFHTLLKNNLISGNKRYGVLSSNASCTAMVDCIIGLNRSGTKALPNYAGIQQIGGDALVLSGNVVSGNRAEGIYLMNSSNCSLYNNYVGVAADGLSSIPNGSDGIFLTGCHKSAILGSVISGNRGNGLALLFSDHSFVAGNFIGLDRFGQAVLPNKKNGLYISGSRHVLIGGVDNFFCNVIAGNAGYGIYLNNASKNKIIDNIIGYTLDRLSELPNQSGGIYFGGTSFDNEVEGNLLQLC